VRHQRREIGELHAAQPLWARLLVEGEMELVPALDEFREQRRPREGVEFRPPCKKEDPQ
jgi:hypothetical protein